MTAEPVRWYAPAPSVAPSVAPSEAWDRENARCVGFV